MQARQRAAKEGESAEGDEATRDANEERSRRGEIALIPYRYARYSAGPRNDERNQNPSKTDRTRTNRAIVISNQSKPI